MKRESSWSILRRVAVLVLIACGAASGLAAQSSGENAGPKNDLTIYLWGAGVHGELVHGSGNEFEVSFEDLIDNLKLAGMAAYKRDLGRWSVLLDLIYLDVGNNRGNSVTVPAGGGLTLGVNADLDLKAWIGGLYGGYGFVESATSNHEFVVGVRYLSLWTDLRLDFDGPLPPTLPSREFFSSSHNWDGVVGLQGSQGLGGAWSLPYHVDVGAGDSEITYQGMVGVAYGFSWGEVEASYRYLYYDLEDGSPVRDLYFDGPAVGFRFEF